MEEELLKLSIEYRDKLSIPDDILFGIEIEFSGANQDDVRKVINHYMNNDHMHKPYKRWVVKGDASVQSEITVNYVSNNLCYQNMDASWDDPYQLECLYERETVVLGGEINSPILHNNSFSWKELEQVCSYLRQMKDMYISDKCSIHFHIDKSIFKGVKHLLHFLKMWMLYEDVIYQFGYGTKSSARSDILVYAKPINSMLFNNLSIINSSYANELDIFRFLSKSRHQAVNFKNIKENGKNTYEVRNSNGTEYSHIIQNTFNFFANLMFLCRDDNFDWDYIDYKIKFFKAMDFSLFNTINIDKALELSNMVFNDELDKLYFMKQYLKLFSDDDKEKFSDIHKQYSL